MGGSGDGDGVLFAGFLDGQLRMRGSSGAPRVQQVPGRCEGLLLPQHGHDHRQASQEATDQGGDESAPPYPDRAVREVIDTADVPAVRRKGVPPNLRERIDIEHIPFREQLEISSNLRQLFLLPGGGFLFTHHDETALKMEPMPVLTAKVWVGILSPDLSKACVDTPVPRDFEIRSMETFRGDTLFVLERRIDDAEKLQTWILMYLVSDEGCDWLSARPGRESG